MQKLGVEKLPRFISPLRKRMVAHKFFNIEELMQLCYDFVTCHRIATIAITAPIIVPMHPLAKSRHSQVCFSGSK